MGHPSFVFELKARKVKRRPLHSYLSFHQNVNHLIRLADATIRHLCGVTDLNQLELCLALKTKWTVANATRNLAMKMRPINSASSDRT
jgi:hypothetical protein